MSTPAASVPTQFVATTGPVTTPVTYRVPGSLELQLSTVSAEYDGTGAGGSFDPTLAVYSKDNKLVSRTKVGSTVAAGGSAVCTWLPFSRKAAAAAPAGGALPWGALYSGFVSKPYPYPGGDTVPFASSILHNNTGGVFTVGGAGNALTLTANAAGLYLVHVQVAWESWPIGTPVQLRLLGMPNYEGENNYNRDSELVTANDQGVMEWVTTIAVNTGSYLFNLIACQSSGVNQWLDGNFLKVVQLSTL